MVIKEMNELFKQMIVIDGLKLYENELHDFCFVALIYIRSQYLVTEIQICFFRFLKRAFSFILRNREFVFLFLLFNLHKLLRNIK